MARREIDDYTTVMPPDITAIKISPGRSVVRTLDDVGDHPQKQFPGNLIQPTLNDNKKRYSIKETDCDIASAKGVFGWTTIDGVNLPFIIRSDDKFVSVRMLEDKVLCRFPSTFAKEVDDYKLVSQKITLHEQSLLNEINVDHCNYEYGNEAFTASDIIVRLDKFQDFYQHIKDTFVEEVTNSQSLGIDLASPKNIRLQSNGWLQINNTLTPYVRRANKKYVVLPILKNAAGLMTDRTFPVEVITEEEYVNLNNICAAAGYVFRFDKSTELVDIDQVKQCHDVILLELPIDNPIENAKYGVTWESLRMAKECNLDNSLQQTTHLTQVSSPPNIEQAVPKSSPYQEPGLSHQMQSQPYLDQSFPQQDLSMASHRPAPVQQIQSPPNEGQILQTQQQQHQQQYQQQYTPSHIQPTVYHTQPSQALRQTQQPVRPQSYQLSPHIETPLPTQHSLQGQASFLAQQPQRHIHPSCQPIQQVHTQTDQMPQLQQMQFVRPIWQPSQRQPVPTQQTPPLLQEKQVSVHQSHNNNLHSVYQYQPTPNSLQLSTLHQQQPAKHRPSPHTPTVAMLIEQRHLMQQSQIRQQQMQSAQCQMQLQQQQQYTVQQHEINNYARNMARSKQTHISNASFPNTNMSTHTGISLEPIHIPNINNEINSNPGYNGSYTVQRVQPTLKESSACQYHIMQSSSFSASNPSIIRALGPSMNETLPMPSDVPANPYHQPLASGGTSFHTSNYSMLQPGYQSVPVSSVSMINSHTSGINTVASNNNMLRRVSRPTVPNPQVQRGPLNLSGAQEHNVSNPSVIPSSINVSSIPSSSPSDCVSNINCSSVNSTILEFQTLHQTPGYNINSRVQAHQPRVPMQQAWQPKQLQHNLPHTSENMSVIETVNAFTPLMQNSTGYLSYAQNPRAVTENQLIRSCETNVVRTRCDPKVKHNITKPAAKPNLPISQSTHNKHVLPPVVSYETTAVPRNDVNIHTSSDIVNTEGLVVSGNVVSGNVVSGNVHCSPLVRSRECSHDKPICASACKHNTITNADCHLTSPVCTSPHSLTAPADQQTCKSQINSTVSTNDEGNLCINVNEKSIATQPRILVDVLNSQNSVIPQNIHSYRTPTHTTSDITANITAHNDVLSNVTNTGACVLENTPDTAVTETQSDITITKVEYLSEVSNVLQCITLIRFHGKALSCLEHQTRKGKHALIKAIHTLFFPMINMSMLVFFIEKIFKIPLVKCSPTEESAFKQYYGLPVAAGGCDKMVELSCLKKYFHCLSSFILSKKDKPLPANENKSKSSKDVATKAGLALSTIPTSHVSKKRTRPFEDSDLPYVPEKQLCLKPDSCKNNFCVKREPLATILTERNSQ